MDDSRDIHEKINLAIHNTPTEELKRRLELVIPRIQIFVDDTPYVCTSSPLTNESVEKLINRELERRGDMTEFVKKPKDKGTVDFIDLDINQPLIFDGGDGTVYIKDNNRHATSLEDNLVHKVDLEDQCIPVEITKVEYKEE